MVAPRYDLSTKWLDAPAIRYSIHTDQNALKIDINGPQNGDKREGVAYVL